MKVVGLHSSEWALEADAAALWARIVAMRPDAITVVLEGAKVDGGDVWLALSAPTLHGVVIGHAHALQAMADDLIPGG
jgi:hypothetical protein